LAYYADYCPLALVSGANLTIALRFCAVSLDLMADF